jgi:tetrahydromethanopterin S-methyltransferase subunit A
MKSPFKEAFSELQKGMKLAKCLKCGCLHGTLKNLSASLPLLKNKDAQELLKHINKWLKELKPQEYPCFGCSYCIPPEAMHILTSRFPSLASSSLLSCDFELSNDSWPTVVGEYSVLNKSAPVAVSILASLKLEEKLVKLKPDGLCIVGKTETENIGIDKVVKNIVTNPAIRFLIVAGKDTEGHHSGKTLLALWENGVNKQMRVIGSPGRRPILKNVSSSDVDAFRKQIKIENMIGCENTTAVIQKVKELSKKAASLVSVSSSTSCCEKDSICKPKPTMGPPKIKAKKTDSIKLDKAGYFVIIPSKKNKTITVEHYSYDNKLLRTIEGTNSRDIYLTIINNKWITELSHAAYLGKELARAELSIKKGFKFVQDKA